MEYAIWGLKGGRGGGGGGHVADLCERYCVVFSWHVTLRTEPVSTRTNPESIAPEKHKF
jgi:hypothetical protein